MSYLDYYSKSYNEAKLRISRAAKDHGLINTQLPLNNGLVIDIFHLNIKSEQTFLLSSGLHGVEGFLGSAIQLSFLESQKLRPDINVIIVHIINPYGMLNNRRWTENNVDLNRNFWLAQPQPNIDLYNKISSLINPKNKTGLKYFKLKAIKNIVKYGFANLQQAIAQGQYHLPKGLFFGGNTHEPENLHLTAFLKKELKSTKELYGLDLHCGLGKPGQELLLLEPTLPSSVKSKLDIMLPGKVNQVQAGEKNNYKIQGGFIESITQYHPKELIYMLTHEIGTTSPIRILKSLVKENYYHNKGQSQELLNAQEEVKLCFLPNNHHWKQHAVEQGLNTVRELYNKI